MTDSIKQLSSIVKTSQIAQVTIHSIIGYAVCPGLKNALKLQLREYHSIERETRSIAAARGWELEFLPLTAKLLASLMIRVQLSSGRVDSKIAAKIIQCNTKGMIKCFQNRHQQNRSDTPVAILSQKLLDCETANIKQMQGFL